MKECTNYSAAECVLLLSFWEILQFELKSWIDTCLENFVSVDTAGEKEYRFKSSCTTRLIESSIPADVLISKKLLVLSYSAF